MEEVCVVPLFSLLVISGMAEGNWGGGHISAKKQKICLMGWIWKGWPSRRSWVKGSDHWISRGIAASWRKRDYKSIRVKETDGFGA